MEDSSTNQKKVQSNLIRRVILKFYSQKHVENIFSPNQVSPLFDVYCTFIREIIPFVVIRPITV